MDFVAWREKDKKAETLEVNSWLRMFWRDLIVYNMSLEKLERLRSEGPIKEGKEASLSYLIHLCQMERLRSLNATTRKMVVSL